MIFKLKATVLKQVWSGGGSYLYQVQETISADRTKNWTLFTKVELSIGAEAVFEGYVSESKDKKVKDANGKDIWRTAYNADSVQLTDQPEQHPEPNFDESSEEIPF